MRTRIATAGFMLGLGMLAGTALAQPASAEAPTLDALRRAVATLPAGRIERPESYDAMSDEQQRYLASVLAGPRSAVSGPLVVMLASPTLGDVAQRTMAYARFAGNEGSSKAVYTFLDEFLETKQVSDATFEAARTALGGDRALVDLIGTLAIYQMSAMLTAVDRTGLEAGAQPTLRPLE